MTTLLTLLPDLSQTKFLRAAFSLSPLESHFNLLVGSLSMHTHTNHTLNPLFKIVSEHSGMIVQLL